MTRSRSASHHFAATEQTTGRSSCRPPVVGPCRRKHSGPLSRHQDFSGERRQYPLQSSLSLSLSQNIGWSIIQVRQALNVRKIRACFFHVFLLYKSQMPSPPLESNDIRWVMKESLACADGCSTNLNIRTSYRIQLIYHPEKLNYLRSPVAMAPSPTPPELVSSRYCIQKVRNRREP